MRSALLSVILLAGCTASDRPPATDAEIVQVDLSEWAFTVSDSTFTAGVPYQFVLTNKGVMAHEWAVVPHGDENEERLLVEVEEDELAPGATHSVVFTFPEPGRYDFACFMPGHFQAGMKLPVTVAPAGI